MAYFLAPSLAKLRAEVNEAWPKRDKASDGWIGDTAHGARKSDHNPDYSAGGVVRALDIDKDGVNVDALVNATISDARTAYVIWNWRIWTRQVGWARYTGTNGHTAHVHISIRHGRAYEQATSSWGIASLASSGGGSRPSLPGGGAITAPTITLPKGPFMALTDSQQQQIYDALVGPNGSPQLQKLMPFGENLPTSLAQTRGALQTVIDALAPVNRDVPVPLRQEIADTKTAVLDVQAALTSALPALLGASGADVDEAALAAALAPLLTAATPTLSDEDLKRVATSVADEQARRLTNGA